MLARNLTFGIINSPFEIGTYTKCFKLYPYAAPLVNVIDYDATLQGSLMNDKSPYTIAAKDVERLTGQFNYGIVLQTNIFHIEYSRTSITKEFATRNSAKWGGFKVGFRF